MQSIDLGDSSNITYLHYNRRSPARELEDVMAQAYSLTQRDTVNIATGDPFIYKGIFKLLAYLKRLKFKEIRILTNARALAYPEFRKYLQPYDNISYYIHLFSHDKGTHDSISGVEGSHEQTLKGLLGITGLNNPVNVVIPLLPQTIGSLKETAALAKRYDINDCIFYLPEISDIDLPAAVAAIKDMQDMGYGIENIPLCLRSNTWYRPNNIMKTQAFSYSEECSSCYLKSICPGFIQKPKNLIPFNDTHSKLDYVLEQIRQTTSVNISKEDIYQISQNLDMKPWDIAYELGYPAPILVKILELLTACRITKPVRRHEKELKLEYERFESNSMFAQLRVNRRDLQQRFDFIKQECPSAGKAAVLGDDDFMSLHLSRHFDKVYVFEIDKRVVQRLNEIAKKNGLPLECIHLDLRKRLPRIYHDRFDVVYTDPLYTDLGFELFISRGVQLLKNCPDKHIFTSFSCEMPMIELEMSVQKSITQMGLFIRNKDCPARNDVPQELRELDTLQKLKDRIYVNNPDLSETERWYLATLGRKEFLFHLNTTKKSQPKLKGTFRDEIYYDEHPFDFYTK